MPSPRYATHDISKTVRATLNPGFLYPLYHRYMLPGDKFKINLRHLIRTEPTIAPVMGRFKVRIVTAVSNLKNYCIALEGYRRSFDWRTVTLPYWRFTFPNQIVNVPFDERFDGTGYFPGYGGLHGVRQTSLADYMGFERGWFPTVQQYGSASSNGSYVGTSYGVLDNNNNYKDINFIPFLMYYDFYRNYMINPQERVCPMVIASNEIIDINGVESLTAQSLITPIEVSKLDDLIESVHKYYDGTNGGSINSLVNTHFDKLVWSSGLNGSANTFSAYHGGLFGTMYDPDINTQWMSVENYSKLNSVTVNSNVSGSVATTSFQDIVKASSLWQFMLGEAYSSGTYADHIYGQYGVSVKSDLNIPQIIHVYDSEVRFEDITSQSDTLQNAGTDDETGSALAQQAGVGRSYGQSPRFTVVNKDGNLALMMIFAWITPMVDYSTGLHSDWNIKKLSDFYVPAFDNYSLQPRLQEQVLSSPIGTHTGDFDVMNPLSQVYIGSNGGVDVMPADAVLGYQPAFAEYKTDVNTVHGLFKGEDDHWVIIRQYAPYGLSQISQGNISSYVYTPYVNKSVGIDQARTYNLPFTVPEIDNFKMQLRLDITAIRPISKSMIPNVK